MSSETIDAAWEALRDAFDTVAALDYDVLSHRELLGVLDRVEALARRLPTVERPVLARLSSEASPVALGARNMSQVLRTRLRISGADARRRLAEAKDLGPRVALTGQPMEPLLAVTAAAQSRGTINSDHVRTVRATLAALPGHVDAVTREQIEADLVTHAQGLDVDAFGQVAKHLLTLVDPDGPVPDERERARRRGVTIGRQGADMMARIEGWLDPQALATWQAIMAKYAAPGMCSPDDPTPCVSGTPKQAQIDGDTRSLAQRQHDALSVIGRHAMASGELGSHNGLPVSVIVSTTLQDLQSAAGVTPTAGGAVLPMADLIRLASRAIHYLRIYDRHTAEELYLGRTKRIATLAQRLVMFARDGGCTAPSCTVPAAGCQAHHVTGWAKDHGLTDVDAMVLACSGDNRMAEHGWTVVLDEGVAKWIPPPELGTGQARTNTYHHPDRVISDHARHAPDDQPGSPNSSNQ